MSFWEGLKTVLYGNRASGDEPTLPITPTPKEELDTTWIKYKNKAGESYRFLDLSIVDQYIIQGCSITNTYGVWVEINGNRQNLCRYLPSEDEAVKIIQDLIGENPRVFNFTALQSE